MPNEEILKYIKDCLSRNYTKDQIKQSLREAGWENSQIDEAFLATQNTTVSLPPLQPKEVTPVIRSYVPEKTEAQKVSPRSILPMAIMAGTAVIIVGIAATFFVFARNVSKPPSLTVEYPAPINATTTNQNLQTMKREAPTAVDDPIKTPTTTGKSVATENNIAQSPLMADKPQSAGANNALATAKQQQIAFQLQSEFLKNEPIAQRIALGELESYDIRKYGFIYGAVNPNADTNDFAYRFMNAIKMTGQVVGGNTIGGHYPSEDLLNRFQVFWGFPISSNINAPVLKKVDSILASREAGEKAVATSFPLYNHFIDAPKNQETKIHVAYILSQTFKELPSNLVAQSEQNFKDYFSLQLKGHYDNINATDYKICDVFLYDSVGDGCKPMTGYPKVLDDFDTANVKIHEYAHYLDRNLYTRNPNTSQGLIDTTGFYRISYDTDQRDLTVIWPSYKLRNPNNERNEFVSAYAMGWTTSNPEYKSSVEDFAESFAMYVNQGKAFRAIAATNSVLKQKYEWLKQNVFGGVEYQSGASDAVQYTKNNSSNISVATGAFNVRDFSQYYPNFVWNYYFLNGSMVAK